MIDCGRVGLLLPFVVTDLTPRMRLQGLGVFEPPEQGSPGSWRGLQGGRLQGGRPTASAEQFMDPKLLFSRSSAAV